MLITNLKEAVELQKVIKNEGDLIEFVYKDIPCTLKRNQLGALCGYCKIPTYVDVKIDNTDIIEVHGGITYTGVWDDYDVFGFDCAHSHDFTPTYPMYHSIYRTKEYCIKECQNMVDQIIELDPNINIYLRDKKLEKIINI